MKRILLILAIMAIMAIPAMALAGNVKEYFALLSNATTTGSDTFYLNYQDTAQLTVKATTSGGSIYIEGHDDTLTGDSEMDWQTITILTSDDVLKLDHNAPNSWKYRARLVPDGTNEWKVWMQRP